MTFPPARVEKVRGWSGWASIRTCDWTSTLVERSPNAKRGRRSAANDDDEARES